jgi:Leucine-rich repeat (LRR) protein
MDYYNTLLKLEFFLKKSSSILLPVKSYSDKIIQQIYELYINDIIEESIDPVYLRYCGLYWCYKQNYSNMKSTYIKSYAYGNTTIYCISMNLKKIPKWITNLTNLTELRLFDNQISKISDNLCKLTQLKYLSLCDNYLTEIPENIGELTQLINLGISNNQLTKIPENIKNLTQLTGLYLYNNKLTEIPENIKNLTQLNILGLATNNLTTLPKYIGDLTQLKNLDIRNNKLIEVPNSIGNLTQLTKLFLFDNQLSQLPESIENLTQLNELYLHNNKSLKLPENIGNLTTLKRLELYNNQITSFSKLFITFIHDKTNNNSVMNLIEYYHKNNNIKLMKKYCSIAKNISPRESYIKLVNYYILVNNREKIIKYLTLGSDNGDYMCTELLAKYYQKYAQYSLMIELYHLFILQSNDNNMNTIIINKIIEYYESINDNESMIKYLIAASDNNICATNKLIEYYESINDTDSMIKYLLIKFKKYKDESIINILNKNLNISIIHELALYYNSILEITKMKEYYLMGILLNDIKSINKMLSYYKNKNIKLNANFKKCLLELNVITSKITDFVISLFDRKQEMNWIYLMCKKHNINNTKINHQIQIIDNKMKFSKIDTCPICFDKNNLILYECFSHYYCLDCLYQGVYKYNKCAICRISAIDTLNNNAHIIPIKDDVDNL